MKNSNLLRLAGFGFFGAVFLSPAPGQNEDAWSPEKLSISRKIPGMPFSMSFLYRENYSLETSAIDHPQVYISKPNFLFSICFTKDPPHKTTDVLFPFYESITNTPPLKPQNSTTQPRARLVKKIPVKPKVTGAEPAAVAEAMQVTNELPRFTIPTDQQQETREITEEYISSTNSPFEYLPFEKDSREEKILPPTDYVDEVITSKKQGIEPVFSSALVPIITTEPESGLDTYPPDLMQARIQELAGYAIENNYSTEYAFIINLGLKSGKKRFFLVDLLHATIIKSGLVAHGRGKEKFTLHKEYSNTLGSACSSLGLYKVGPAYRGGFGKSFRLIGLEKTNNNALSRAIVLHSMRCIPNKEIPYPICQSEGCPSLSPEFLEEISPVIKKSEKPMLLWVFDPTIDHNRVL